MECTYNNFEIIGVSEHDLNRINQIVHSLNYKFS